MQYRVGSVVVQNMHVWAVSRLLVLRQNPHTYRLNIIQRITALVSRPLSLHLVFSFNRQSNQHFPFTCNNHINTSLVNGCLFWSRWMSQAVVAVVSHRSQPEHFQFRTSSKYHRGIESRVVTREKLTAAKGD